MLASISNTPPFDFKSYLEKIEEKTLEIEQSSVAVEQGIEERDAHLIRLTQTVQKDLKDIKTRLEGYRQQLELIKKDLLAILKNYKLAARKDEFAKLQERIDRLGFEKNITRTEFRNLIAAHSLKKK